MRTRDLIFAGLLLVGLSAIGVAQGTKPTRKALEQKKAAVEKKASAIRKEIQANRREASAVLADIRQIDSELDEANDQLQTTTRRLLDAREEQRQIAARLDEAEKTVKTCRDAIGQRLWAEYLRGEQSPLSILIGSESFADVVERAYVMERMAARDREMVDEFLAAKARIEEEKQAADAIVAKIESLRQRQVAQKQQLDRAMSRKRSLLKELNQTREHLQDQLDEIERESRKIEAELAKYYASGGSNVPVYRGKLMQPIPGSIGSGFGMRTHPISGQYKMHNGVDIMGRTGDPIRAAAPGKVIFAGWRGGYGNCVIIDHGGGLSTLYAHASKIYVSQGQSVSQGQTIAAVGSTGYSTGPHLHWEVRINGKPVNPVGR